MNSTLTKITTIEAICFIVISTLNRIILNLPQQIIHSCGSSSLLNVAYISIIAIIITFIIIKLFKNFTSYDIIDISEFIGGPIFKKIIGVIICLYLIAYSSFLVRNFSDVINCIYYRETTFIFLLLFFVGTAFISNLFGKKSIFRVNVVITTIMMISLIITFISVFPNIVWQRIFPIWGNGLSSTFLSGIGNISSFNGLVLIYFVCPFLAEKNAFKKVSILSIVIISVLLFVSIACLLLSLSFSNSLKDISSFYTLITNNEFGDFFQHPEALFMSTWILSVISFLNLMVLLVLNFSKKILQINNYKIILLVICITIFVLALIPHNIIEAQKLEDFIYRWINIPLAIIIFPIILIIANIKFKKRAANSNMRKDLNYE